MKTKPRSFQIAVVTATFLLLATATAAAEKKRYLAIWRDGQVTAERNRPKWNSPPERPHFTGRNLFDPQQPVLLLRDLENDARLEPPFLVMSNGDILPGVVVQFVSSSPLTSQPAHLLVELRGELGCYDEQRLAVRLDRVRRIVAAKGADLSSHTRGLTTRDGRHILMRGVRWQETAASLLTNEGIVRVGFSEIADLWLPGAHSDASLPDALLPDELCYPYPDLEALVCRLTNRQGAVISYRRDLLRSSNRLLANRERKSVHVVQPSWSLRPIYVARDSVVQRSYRKAREVPLSLLPAATLRRKAGVHYLRWRRNRNVGGGELRSQVLAADLGVGTHSHSEIAFTLPSGAARFSSWAGIDRASGAGGCVECKIYRDEVRGEPVWKSGHLRGGQPPQRIGDLNISGAKRLVLVTQFAHQGRPQDADPLDIRDHLDWLFPMVSVDLELSAETRRAFRFLPGLNDWEISPQHQQAIQILPPEWHREERSWPVGIRTNGSDPIILNSQHRIQENNQHLMLRLEPIHGFPRDAAVLMVGEETVQPRVLTQGKRKTLIWDLSAWRGDSPPLKLVLQTGDQTGGVRWFGLGSGPAYALLPMLPTDDFAFQLWKGTHAALGDRPERARRLKRDILAAHGDEALRWLPQFLAGGPAESRAERVAELENLIGELSFAPSVLEGLQRELSPTHIRAWRIVGPFLFDPSKRLKTQLPPEQQPFQANAVYPGLRGDVRWKSHFSSADKIDLAAVLGTTEPGIAYAICWVRSGREQEVRVDLGSDDGIAVLINRKPQFEQVTNRSAAPRQDSFTTKLRSGWNEILVKVDNTQLAWEFYLELRDPTGMRRPSNLRDSSSPPDS